MIAAPASQVAASGHGGGGEAGSLNLVPMDAFEIPIVETDRLQGRLAFKLVLEGQDAAAAAQMTADLPHLRETAFAAGTEFARLHASGFTAVDAERLDHDLTAALQAADHGVSRVLIVEVSARRT